MYLCVIGAIASAIFRNIHAFLPSVAGALIFFLFYGLKRFSYLLITDRDIKIRLGIIAHGKVLFADIARVTRVTQKAIHGIGVRACGKGELAVVTAVGEVVRLELKKKSRLRMFGFIGMSFSNLRISPEKQDEFIAMVNERIPGQ
jgi:hypothetical protein